MHWKQARESMLQHLFDYERIGLITDVDGTISPIVDQPDRAQVTPRNRELLQQLNQYLSFVGVVSGRSATDVATRVGIPELVYVGNHGLERWENGSLKPSPQLAEYRPALESARDALQEHMMAGAMIEDKQATLSIHYRQTADPTAFAQTLEPIVRQVSMDEGLRYFQGRMVFELRPPLDVHKGTAFYQLITDYRLDAALYIGDDTTDVDALKMARHLRDSGQCYTLAIGVDSDDSPASVRDNSDVLVSGVPDVESFLDWLLSAARASSS